MRKICVIGSFNIDFSQRVAEFPRGGETIASSRFSVSFGGKGANQAVAVCSLGEKALMAGLLGNDPYGTQYEQKLAERGMDLRAVRHRETNTGVAVVTVNSHGENTIVITPGANALVDEEYLKSVSDVLLENDIFLLQQEIPSSSVDYAVRMLKAAGKTIILDPAPVRPIPAETLEGIDFITPNQVEASYLSGVEIRDKSDLSAAGAKLLEKGVRSVIIKAGENGSYLFRGGHGEFFSAYPVETQDTTGAGDAFNAGFAVALAAGWELGKCMRFANAVGALSTTCAGAQDGVPSRLEAEHFLEAREAAAPGETC